jgi:hypothetical protein
MMAVALARGTAAEERPQARGATHRGGVARRQGRRLARGIVAVGMLGGIAAAGVLGLDSRAEATPSRAVATELASALAQAGRAATSSGAQARLWVCEVAGAHCPESGVFVVELATEPGAGTLDDARWARAALGGMTERRGAWVSAIRDAAGHALEGNVSVTFYPDGRADGRVIDVSDLSGAIPYQIHVDAATGRVALARPRGA